MAWQDTFMDLRDNWFGDVAVGAVSLSAGWRHIVSPADSLFGKFFAMFTEVGGGAIEFVLAILGILVIVFGITELLEAWDRLS